MSKSTIKKMLKSMKKEDIIEMVLDLYSARKEAKEYLDMEWATKFTYDYGDMYEEGNINNHNIATKYPTTRMTEAEIKRMFGV